MTVVDFRRCTNDAQRQRGRQWRRATGNANTAILTAGHTRVRMRPGNEGGGRADDSWCANVICRVSRRSFRRRRRTKLLVPYIFHDRVNIVNNNNDNNDVDNNKIMSCTFVRRVCGQEHWAYTIKRVSESQCYTITCND